MLLGLAALDGRCTDSLDVVLDGMYVTREQPGESAYGGEEEWEGEYDAHDDW